jgi:cysteine desulfurase
LRDRLEHGVLARVSGVSLHGHRELRVPNISNMSFLSIEGEPLLLVLDMGGISVSSGAACSAGSTEPSHVLRAMGIDRNSALGALRFSLGRQNTEAEVDEVIGAISEAVDRLRGLPPFAKNR